MTLETTSIEIVSTILESWTRLKMGARGHFFLAQIRGRFPFERMAKRLLGIAYVGKRPLPLV